MKPTLVFLIILFVSCSRSSKNKEGNIQIGDVQKLILEDQNEMHVRSDGNVYADSSILESDLTFVSITENKNLITYDEQVSSWATLRNDTLVITCTNDADLTGLQYVFYCYQNKYYCEDQSWTDVTDVNEAKINKRYFDYYPLQLNKKKYIKGDTIYGKTVLTWKSYSGTEKYIDYIKFTIRAIVK